MTGAVLIQTLEEYSRWTYNLTTTSLRVRRYLNHYTPFICLQNSFLGLNSFLFDLKMVPLQQSIPLRGATLI